jgi:hypothetical protein
MDVMSAILACSLYLDDPLVRAIVESTSQSNPLFVQNVSIDSAPAVGTPTTVDEAVAQSEMITKYGGRAVVGLMQVPIVWLAGFGRSVREAFDPCVNVTVGTTMLSNFAYECSRSTGTRERKALRPCITRKYATAAGMLDFEVITRLELEVQQPKNAEPIDAPIYRQGWRSWGVESILVSFPGAP